LGRTTETDNVLAVHFYLCTAVVYVLAQLSAFECNSYLLLEIAKQ